MDLFISFDLSSIRPLSYWVFSWAASTDLCKSNIHMLYIVYTSCWLLLFYIRINVECNTFFHSKLLLSYRCSFVYDFTALSFDQVARHIIIRHSKTHTLTQKEFARTPNTEYYCFFIWIRSTFAIKICFFVSYSHWIYNIYNIFHRNSSSHTDKNLFIKHNLSPYRN